MILQAIRKFNFIGKFYASTWGKKWVESKLKNVLPHLNKKDKIIDIGCGNCMVIKTLQENGYTCTALDVADLSIVENIKVVIYDGEKMPFENQDFDAALLLTVLHHSDNPELVLKETARIAKKIVIIEDIYSNKIQQYLTYFMDTLVNLGHSNMTYQNKSDAEWKKVFETLQLKLVAESSRPVLLFFRQATYILEIL